MSEAPLVSVVVPVYNAEPYLRKCLDSLFGQTLKEIEIIAVDDGSTDGSGKILNECAARDRRLKVIHQENAGVSAARNRGIKAARGRYLTFVDADDRIDRQALCYLCFEAERLQTDILLFNYAACENGLYHRCPLLDELYRRFGDRAFDYAEGKDLLYYVHGTAAGKFYRTRMIRERGLEFPLSTFIGEDLCFWAEALLAAERLAVSGNVFYFYRKDNEHSLSKRLSDLGEQQLKGYCGLKERLRRKLTPEAFREADFYLIDRNMALFTWNYSLLKDPNLRREFRRRMREFMRYPAEYTPEEQKKFRYLKAFKRMQKPAKKRFSVAGIRFSFGKKE